MRSDKKDKNLKDKTPARNEYGDKSASDAENARGTDGRAQGGNTVRRAASDGTLKAKKSSVGKTGGKKVAERDKKADLNGQKAEGEKVCENKTEVKPKRGARVPAVATVRIGDGKKIGKVRSGVWYGEDGGEVGRFAVKDGAVLLEEGGRKVAVLDENDNLFDNDGGYVATIKRFPALVCALIALAAAAIIAFSVCLGAYFMKSSESVIYPDYAPVMFVADAAGENLDGNHNLSVFYNDLFGTQKIAPGMSGSYAFTVRNENENTIEFSISFSCVNDYGIDIAYSLSRDGALISGAEEKVPAEQVGVRNLTIQPLSETVFVLDWEWRDEDERDTAAGQNGATYRLDITFTAQVWQGD